jgi:aldose 1-epimerase
MPIILEQGDARVVIEPQIGGSIAGYTVRGRDVLRPAPTNAASPLEMSCFPLVPFANRIARGTFRWQGRSIVLRPNFGDESHPLHGQGWQSAWRVAEKNTAHAVLIYDHEAGEWPWAYRAELNFSLGAAGLHAVLLLTNRGTDPMPASIGFHPYFPKHRRSGLTAAVDGMWLADKTLIPATRGAPILDFAKGAALDAAPQIDNCFTGWTGCAVIDQTDLQIVLKADARFLHIFVPVGGDYFCAEPVTAMPDAFNRAEPRDETGLLSLAPGATHTVSMTIAPRDAVS